MDNGRDRQMQEILNEMADDTGGIGNKNVSHRRRTSLDSKRRTRTLVLGGIVVLILVVVFTLFLSNDENSREDLNFVKKRLGKIEERLAQVESHAKGLEQSLSKIDKSGRALTQQLNTLTNKIDSFEKTLASISMQTKARSGTKKKVILQGKERYHEVRRGDTLSGIARQHGTSVDELCRLNSLAPKTLIHPGQKILVVR